MTSLFRSGLAAAFAALAFMHTAACGAVIVEQPFADGLGSFAVSGSAATGTYGVRLRGGASPGRLTSPAIDIGGYSQVKLTVDRTSSGLDAGETTSIIAVVDGQSRTLEATRSASGAVSFDLGTGARSVSLQLAINASSALETYTIARIALEGERTGGCPGSPNCEPPSTARTLVPDSTWTCGMPAGIPDPSNGTLVFTTVLAADAPQNVGTTPYGQRRVTSTRGGTLSGGTLNGSILSGALDFDLTLPSGAVEHEARYAIRTSSGTLIYLRNCGVADGNDVRFVADFEAPSSSSFQWLNSGTYVGRRQVTASGIKLSVYAVSATPNPSHPVVRIAADPSVRQQAYTCANAPASAAQGAQVMQARVNIGSSLSVGESKRGRRNIIPITGGSYSGSLGSGTVNAGGADYQLNTSAGLQIEARYTVKASNGETIVVRNCGDFGTADLTAVILEARTDGAHAGLNNRSFVGTITPGLGRVTITVYEKK